MKISCIQMDMRCAKPDENFARAQQLVRHADAMIGCRQRGSDPTLGGGRLHGRDDRKTIVVFGVVV